LGSWAIMAQRGGFSDSCGGFGAPTNLRDPAEPAEHCAWRGGATVDVRCATPKVSLAAQLSVALSAF
jgi:hypothetical protein